MDRNIWLLGHTLSRMGLIESACQMRDVANYRPEGDEAVEQAREILDGLYYKHGFIDQEQWKVLCRQLEYNSNCPNLGKLSD